MKNFIGTSLQEVRKEVGMTQENVAKLCGVTATYIRMVETGSIKPTDYMLDKILEVIGLCVIVKNYLDSLVDDKFSPSKI